MSASGLQSVPLSEIEPWPGLNPRRAFDEEQLTELAKSIEKDGLLQPVAAAPAGEAATNGARLWLFAGERRLRASELIGAETIDVLVRDVDEATAHRLAGLENIDRSDLTAIEEAKWLERELELTGLSQSELAVEIDRSQSWIANRIRLLALPEDLQELVQEGVLAPATARDVLLRFLKLDEDLQKKVFGAITKRLKKKADGEALPARDVKVAVAEALDSSKATNISEGHNWTGNYSAHVTPSAFKRFRKEHDGRCIQAPSGWDGSTERWWTFEAKAWKDFLMQEQKKQAAREKKKAERGGPDPEMLADPGLGPEHEPTTHRDLRDRFGWEYVVDLDNIADPSEIDPTHVVRATYDDWENNERVEREALYYVGPDARELGRTRVAAIEEETRRVRAREYKSVLKKAGSMDVVDVLRGMVEFALQSNVHEDVVAILEAEGLDLPEVSRYSDEPQLTGVELDPESAWRVAGAISTLCGSSRKNSWDRQREARDKAEKKLEPKWEKAREAWLAEHWGEGA